MSIRTRQYQLYLDKSGKNNRSGGYDVGLGTTHNIKNKIKLYFDKKNITSFNLNTKYLLEKEEVQIYKRDGEKLDNKKLYSIIEWSLNKLIEIKEMDVSFVRMSKENILKGGILKNIDAEIKTILDFKDKEKYIENIKLIKIVFTFCFISTLSNFNLKKYKDGYLFLFKEYDKELIYDDEKITQALSVIESEIQEEEEEEEEERVKVNIPLNILFIGVPGVGKSWNIDNLINKKFRITKDKILKINVHEGLSNSDLINGIGVNINNGIVEYKEKKGIILSFIQAAIIDRRNNYILVLEEIQENSINNLLGDLIYLIEESKRVNIEKRKFKNENVDLYINRIINSQKTLNYVNVPNLVEINNDKKMIIPDNFYIMCTANYRENKKIVEDNLLRRFIPIIINPDPELINNNDIKDFFKLLNKSILNNLNYGDKESYISGHSDWMNANSIMIPLYKVIFNLKTCKNLEFEEIKNILSEIKDNIKEDNKFKKDIQILSNFNCYIDLINYINKEIYKGILN